MKQFLIGISALLVLFSPVESMAGCKVEHKTMPCSILPGISEREYTVCLPDGYEKSQEKYPVLYLLHGGGCSNTDWTQFGRLQQVVDSLVTAGKMQKMIIVCPEANQGGRMIWFKEPEWKFEDYFFHEMIPYIETKYRVNRQPGMRSVAGFSMGGGGSVGYGLHHPEMFNVVYAMSAYLRRQPLDFLKNDPLGEWRQQDVERNNPIKMVNAANDEQVKNWRNVKWFIDCGDQDFTLDGNMDFVKSLREKHINYELRVRSGAHNWDYWKSSLIQALQYVSEQTQNRFSNPVLWADVPDPDVIRVGDYFYLVSTTMHLMPGAPIMRSKDLVNWETIGYIFDKLTDSPKYDMKDGTVYGRGQWATSLKYHKGKFYALFAPNDNPGGETYIYSTSNPAGKWNLVSRMRHFHDATLFFDDDDRVYVIYGTGQICELKSDLSGVKEGTDVKLFERDSEEKGLLEGSRMIKHNGKYYLLMISWTAGHPRREVCFRADSIHGKYEKKVVLETLFAGFGGVGQGTIVDTPKGDWYGFVFQDRGGVGRVPTLESCRWIDGWPILGDEFGNVPGMMDKPVKGCPTKTIISSDEFDQDKLKLDWQWNHNPIDSAWSLTERPGYLRLKTSRIVNNIFEAPNTISQRMGGPMCSGVVCLDLSGMKDGDKTGVAAFNGDSGILTISKNGKKKILTMSEESVRLTEQEKAVTDVKQVVKETVKIKGDKIYLKIVADFSLGKDIANFYYSVDNKEWKKIGKDYRMIFDYRRFFMGTRFAIFNYATKQNGGYVDVDFFRYN